MHTAQMNEVIKEIMHCFNGWPYKNKYASFMANESKIN